MSESSGHGSALIVRRAAEEQEPTRRGVVAHRRAAAAGWGPAVPKGSTLRPRRAVPVRDRVRELTGRAHAAEEHDRLRLRVVGHRWVAPRARRRPRRRLRPVRAVPEPHAPVVFLVEIGACTGGVVRDHVVPARGRCGRRMELGPVRSVPRPRVTECRRTGSAAEHHDHVTSPVVDHRRVLAGGLVAGWACDHVRVAPSNSQVSPASPDAVPPPKRTVRSSAASYTIAARLARRRVGRARDREPRASRPRIRVGPGCWLHGRGLCRRHSEQEHHRCARGRDPDMTFPDHATPSLSA